MASENFHERNVSKSNYQRERKFFFYEACLESGGLNSKELFFSETSVITRLQIIFSQKGNFILMT